MPDPVFIGEESILALHEDLIQAHGGLWGEDRNLVGSVAGYPLQRYHYEHPPPDIPTLGAYYALAAAQFHAFRDGNKRVALALLDMFLLSNGYELTSSPTENEEVMLELASGNIGEEDLVNWVKDNSVRVIE